VIFFFGGVAYKFGPLFSRVCCDCFLVGLLIILLWDLFFCGVAYRIFGSVGLQYDTGYGRLDSSRFQWNILEI
jgi:hypothetical protein